MFLFLYIFQAGGAALPQALRQPIRRAQPQELLPGLNYLTRFILK
jgi:hypothetical protein